LSTVGRQHGFSLMEVMVAVVLLAICAVPLADALRNGIGATTIGAAKARELRCMKNTMETVLAQSHGVLLAAADAADGYTVPDDPACDAALQRRVDIRWYEYEYGKVPVYLDKSASAARKEAALLHITVSSPQSAYTFTTLVQR
jgi:prepilin-type N-terminal cleavage/methylation domain-containing protein